MDERTTPRWRAWLKRRSRKWGRYGVKGWLVLLRRAAPWALLAVALLQIRTLADKVRRLEEQELGAVESEVVGLRKDLKKMRGDVQEADQELVQARTAFRVVEDTIDRARHRAPELTHALDEANASSQALREAIPPADQVTQLKQSLQTAGSELAGVVTSLPSADATRQLAKDLDAATHGVESLEQSLPTAERGTTLAATVAAEQKRLDALDAALPKAEAASALNSAMESEHKRLDALATALALPKPALAQKLEAKAPPAPEIAPK
jgi:chromosome segregation ATPase